MASGLQSTNDILKREPSEGFREGKRLIANTVSAAGAELIELSHRIHANPELSLEEHQAASWIASILAQHGFRVEHPVGRLETAIRATLPGGLGKRGRRVGVLAEYDALPGIGHACGHNTMAASGVGAAIGLAAIAPKVAGEIVFLGTPAEERFSGKQDMIDDGLFEGLDAVLLYHPGDETHMAANPLALEDVEVEFVGQSAHASAAPWLGRNALDAMTLLLVAVGLWRQQLEPGSQVHGVITEGGEASNIIPERSVGHFNIRSKSDDGLAEMQRRFRDLVTAAALGSACEGNVRFFGRSLTMWNNGPLLDRFRANLGAYGIRVDTEDVEQSGSSDMGNVSKIAPTIHPHVAICDPGVPLHSIGFRDAAMTPRADAVTLVVATVIAQTAYEVLVDPELGRDVRNEFDHQRTR